MSAMQYRKRPVVIEAMHLNSDVDPATALDCLKWIRDGGGRGNLLNGGAICIATLEGVMTAAPGDWIIRGVRGEFYPCRGDIFVATYEAVPPAEVPA